MKSNELRIGNIIKAENKIVEVNYLTPVSIGYGNGNFAPHDSIMAFFEPILITRDILLKMGFQKRVTIDFCECYFIGENPITKDWLIHFKWLKDELFPFYNNGYFTVKSVHQIQNLYFAITNEELVLNKNQFIIN